MSHSWHEGQPGYSPAQILHPDCAECEFRSRNIHVAIAHLDQFSFMSAWVRAAEFGRGELTDTTEAEGPLLDALFAVQIQMERLGVPIGTLPVGEMA